MKPPTKLDKIHKATSKSLDDNVVSENCGAIVFFPIYGQFGAIRKPNSRRISCKTFILLKVTFYLKKTENKTKKFLTQS